MSIPKEPREAKLVIGLFMKDKDLLALAAEKLADTFGQVDMVSPWLAFDFTEYYSREMGSPLFRRLLTFTAPVSQDKLADIKLVTNRLETRFLEGDRRRLNIDPGLMTHERFVLATGKNFTHRIYLGRGIFADLTLIYTKGRFQSLPWTYPDYQDHRMLAFLEKVRNKYVMDLKNSRRESAT